MSHYPSVGNVQSRLLAILSAAEIHPPSDFDMTTSDVIDAYPDDPSRKRVVRALRELSDKGYISSGWTNPYGTGRVISWKITTKGLRVALGVLA